MELPPFLLEQWLAKHSFGAQPLVCDLASSTGPHWHLKDILALGGGPGGLENIVLGYGPPEGSTALRKAIAVFHGVDPDWVIVTTGASEALAILLCAASGTDAELVIPDPGYPAYAAMASAWRMTPRFYHIDRDGGYLQRADIVMRSVNRRTAAAIVNTPHNPTGSVMDRSEVLALAEQCGDDGIPLVVDEVYHPLYFGGAQTSAADIPNVIVVGDMSKALSLPGLRVGWIIVSDAELRSRLVNTRSYFTICNSPLLEGIAAHALSQARMIVERARGVASANLEALEEAIGKSSGALAWSRPEGGCTAFPWLRDYRDSRPICEALAAAGVLVAPGVCFGHPAHIRIGIAGSTTGFKVAVGALIAAIDNQQNEQNRRHCHH